MRDRDCLPASRSDVVVVDTSHMPTCPNEDTTEPASRPGSRVARLIPWFGTAIALAWIAWTTDIDGAVNAIARANWFVFFGSMCALFAAVWVIDTVAIHWLYRRFHNVDVRFRDVLPARGLTYVLGILTYSAGTAALVLYFKRRYRVGIIEGGATLVVLMLVDLGILLLVVALGAPLLPASYQGPALMVGALFAGGAIAHLVFWRARWSWGPLERVRQIPAFRGLRQARLRDYVVLGVMRLPVVALYIAMHFATLSAFAIHVPAIRLLVYVPIQMVVAAIPISVGGLGTVQAAQRVLYAPYVVDDDLGATISEAYALASIDAYGISLFVGFAVPRIIIGLLCVRRVSRATEEGPLDDTAIDAAPLTSDAAP